MNNSIQKNNRVPATYNISKRRLKELGGLVLMMGVGLIYVLLATVPWFVLTGAG